jgi:hypothetical protein
MRIALELPPRPGKSLAVGAGRQSVCTKLRKWHVVMGSISASLMVFPGMDNFPEYRTETLGQIEAAGISRFGRSGTGKKPAEFRERFKEEKWSRLQTKRPRP